MEATGDDRSNEKDTPKGNIPTQEEVLPVEVIDGHRPQPWEGEPEKHNDAYTEGEKEKVLALLETEGKVNIKQWRRETGIDLRTIRAVLLDHKQMQQVQSDLHDASMIPLYERLETELVRALDTSKLAKASARDIAIAMGILRDKMPGIRGKADTSGGNRARVAWQGSDGSRFAVEVT